MNFFSPGLKIWSGSVWVPGSVFGHPSISACLENKFTQNPLHAQNSQMEILWTMFCLEYTKVPDISEHCKGTEKFPFTSNCVGCLDNDGWWLLCSHTSVHEVNSHIWNFPQLENKAGVNLPWYSRGIPFLLLFAKPQTSAFCPPWCFEQLWHLCLQGNWTKKAMFHRNLESSAWVPLWNWSHWTPQKHCFQSSGLFSFSQKF